MTWLMRVVALLLMGPFLLGGVEPVAAQVESPAEMMMRDKPPALPPPPQPAAEVEELSLPTYYLQDESGQLVPVLKRLTYEEWEQLYKAKLELANPDKPPRFIFNSLKLTGELAEDAVEFSLQVELELMATGWIRVPLRLSRAALLAPLECEEDQQCFLQYDAESGYVLWVRVPPHALPATEAGESTEDPSATPEGSEPNAEQPSPKASLQRSYRLKFSVPVASNGSERELLLDLPRQVVAAELVLLAEASLTFTPPPMLRLGREAVGNEQVRLTAAGLSGEFRLRWNRPATSPSRPQLDVQTIVLTELSGTRSVKSTVQFRLRSLNGPLHQFAVLLPPNMNVVSPLSNEVYRILSEGASEEAASVGERQLVEIQLQKPSSEPVELTLTAASRPSQQQPYSQLDITGFEVREAKLQSGYHALAVEGDWYLHWTLENNNLRQVDVFPESVEAVLARWKAKDVTVRFHCLSFPINLRVRVTPQRSLVQVEPTYRVSVSAQQLVLEGTLQYKVRGRKLELLELDLADWQQPSFLPESLVRAEAVVSENGVYSIPLQQPTGGEFTLKLRATYPLEGQSGKFSFQLPSIRTSQPEREQLTVSPGLLAMISDDDVLVSPRIEELKGLVPEASASIENLPEREQPPRFYRQLSESTEHSSFAGQVQVMPQSVAVHCDVTIEPEPTRFDVSVLLRYTIKHKPLQWLVLEVPQELVEIDTLSAELQLDGRTVEPIVLPAEQGQTASVMVTLPEKQRGIFELTANYTWKRPAAAGENSAPVAIGLIRPRREGQFAAVSSHLTLVGVSAEWLADDSPWTRVESAALENLAAADHAQFRAEGLMSSVVMHPVSVEQGSHRLVSVSLAWYQTWLTSTRRRDRAVFRLESTQDQVQLQLPAGTAAEQLELRVDGQGGTIRRVVPTENTLLVQLPPQRSEHVIEIMYEVAVRRPTHLWEGGLANYQFAQLAGSQPDRFYWQVVLPSNEYLWYQPPGVASEAQWNLASLLAPPEPGVTQQQLEQFSGATPTPPPAAGAHVYVFSGFGQLEQLSLGVVQRRLVVLLGAGLVLALALPVIYMPGLRGWKALLVAGVCLLLLGLAFPYPAQVLGSSVIAGCLLVLLARLLQIVLSRRRQGPRILPPRDSVATQTSPGSYHLEAPGSSHGTTATSPAMVASSAGSQEGAT